MECTSSAIHKLERLLLCRVCENLLTDPSNISACDHLFCRKCVLSVLHDTGKSCCPVCNLPSWIKDIQPNHQIANLVNGICTIKELLSRKSRSSPSDKIQTSIHQLSSPSATRTLCHRWAGHKRKFSYDDLIVTRDHDGLRTVQEMKAVSMAVQLDVFSPVFSKTRGFSKLDPLAKRQKIKQYTKVDSRTNSARLGRCSGGSSSLRLEAVKPNIRGETPLHVASIKGDAALVQSLLDQGVDPNAQDNAGWTPLHEACNHGNLTVVQLLLSNGAIVNVPGYHNNTPLHDAVENNHVRIAKYLREHGADCSIRNHYGFTAKELAMSDVMRDALSTPVYSVGPVQKVCSVRKATVVLTSGLKPDQKSLLQKTVINLGGSLTERLSEEVTHVVTCCDENLCCSRTVKCLSAIAAGMWLVDYHWVISCNSRNEWIDEEEFEVKGFIVNNKKCVTSGPKKGRVSNKLKKEPGLFDGCEVYFSGVYRSPLPCKEDLARLVLLADGKVLAREPRGNNNTTTIPLLASYPFHASPSSTFSSCHVIVIHPSCDAHIKGSNIVHISASWILDCFTHFKLINFPTL